MAILTSDLSRAGRRRLLGHVGEPLFLAAWQRSVFLHYEADPALLQRQVPFALDLREGRAFVSLVAFTLWRMRPRLGGLLSEWLFKPIASHDFLNVRTYVQHNAEPGIFFLALIWTGIPGNGFPVGGGQNAAKAANRFRC